MPYTVYILFSALKGKYYIGFTGDALDERLRKHHSNHKSFTGAVTDWVVVHIEKYMSKEEAVLREKQIKN